MSRQGIHCSICAIGAAWAWSGRGGTGGLGWGWAGHPRSRTHALRHEESRMVRWHGYRAATRDYRSSDVWSVNWGGCGLSCDGEINASHRARSESGASDRVPRGWIGLGWTDPRVCAQSLPPNPGGSRSRSSGVRGDPTPQRWHPDWAGCIRCRCWISTQWTFTRPPVNLWLSHLIQFLVELLNSYKRNDEPQKHLGHTWKIGKRFCKTSRVSFSTLSAGFESMESLLRTTTLNTVGEACESYTSSGSKVPLKTISQEFSHP